MYDSVCSASLFMLPGFVSQNIRADLLLLTETERIDYDVRTNKLQCKVMNEPSRIIIFAI